MSHALFPRIEPLGGNRYRLAEPFEYQWEKEGRTYRLTVPAGFENDLASVPRILWWLISPFDLGFAVIPHDWLYAHQGQPPAESFLRLSGGEWLPLAEVWSRRDVDRLFGRLMREAHVSRWKRRLAFLAVRLFGWWAWGRM